MKKTGICLLLAMMLLLPMLFSCNGDPTDEQPDDPGKAEQPDQPSEPVYDPKTDNEAVATLNLIAGGASEYVIVRGKEASPSEVTASTELQKYLKEISGVELPIVTDDTAPIKTEIVVGKTNREADGEFDRKKLGDDGFLIKTRANRLFLVGGEQRGTLYSVYEFLEAYMGCRFYTASFEKIPENKTITLDAIEGDMQIPSFDTRTLYWYEYLQNDAFAAKRRMNHRRWGAYSEEYGGSGTWAGGYPVHSLPYILNGTGLMPGKQPCFTNAAVYECVLDWAMKALEEMPDAEFIDISAADNESYCRCENCAALEEEYGAYSGVLLDFVNRIAEDIGKKYPDVMVHTIAYRGTDVCPEGIEPAENVIIELCTPYECKSHPLDESDQCHTTRSAIPFNENIEKWYEICENLAIWDYTTNYYDYSITYPDFDVLLSNIRLFNENGVTALFEQGNYEATSLEFGELRSYILSKMMWNARISSAEVEALVTEFIMDYYGPGGENIREYLHVAERLSEDKCFFMQSNALDIYDWKGEVVKHHESNTVPQGLTVEMIRDYKNVDWSQYVYWYSSSTPRIISEGDRLFTQALEMAENDEQRAHIERSYMQVHTLRSYYLYNEKSKTSSFLSQLFGTGIPSVYPDAFTKDELNTIRSAVAGLLKAQVADAYVAYNRDLAFKMNEYGALYREGSKPYREDDPTYRNYANLPTNWKQP